MAFNGSHRRKLVTLFAGLVLAFVAAASLATSAESGATDDAISRLGRKLADGVETLQYRDQGGYLPSLLSLLGINVDSQVLVFSKTSFQHTLINPKNPRAVYFNDNVSIGMVPGGT